MDEVVRLEEYCPETGFANGVILQIELVKSMERIGVGLSRLVPGASLFGGRG